MLNVDQVVADCRAALRQSSPELAVKEIVERAVASPSEVESALGAPREGKIGVLHHDRDLTILNVVWTPGMAVYPHDHRMWAVIGIYAGAEDNAFFRRPTPDSRTIVESGGKHLDVGDTIILGDDVIHQVSNPVQKLTGAIHVYGGDFINQPRSQWGDPPYEERPWEMAEARQQFADANAAWHNT